MSLLAVTKHSLEVSAISILFGLAVSLLLWPTTALLNNLTVHLEQNSSVNSIFYYPDSHLRFQPQRIGLMCIVVVIWATGLGGVHFVVLGCFYPKSARTIAMYGVATFLGLMLQFLGLVFLRDCEIPLLLYSVCVIVVGSVLCAFAIRHNEEGNALIKFTVVFMLLSAIVAAVYEAVLLRAYFDTNSILTPILVRTIAHTALKVLSMSLCFRLLMMLKNANPQALHVFFFGPTVFLTMVGRFMQVASTNIVLVVITELATVMLEFSEMYGYMKLNRTLALVRDLGGRVGGATELSVISPSSPSPPTQKPFSRRVSFSLATTVSPLPPEAYANVISSLAIVEAASVLISAAFLLLVDSNPYSSTEKAISANRVLTNAAIVLFSELVSDLLVNWYNSVSQIGLRNEVNLSQSWQTRNRRLDLALLFVLASIALLATLDTASYLCADHSSGHRTVLRRCL